MRIVFPAVDAAANLASRTRTGSGVGPVTIETSTYDLNGNLATNWNALGKMTRYSESNGTNKTTIFPDGGTRIERYNRDGTLYKVEGTAVHPVQYQYGYDSGMLFTKEIKLASDGSTNEWKATYTDQFGRTAKVVFSDTKTIQFRYNEKGQLTNELDPDDVSTIYAYNGKAELEYTILDMNRNNVIDWTGPDRITQTVTDYSTSLATLPSTSGRRVRTWVYDTPTATPTLVSEENFALTSQNSGSKRLTLTNKTVVAQSGTARTETTTHPDGSFTVNLFNAGRPTSSTRQDSGGNILSQTTITYDEFGRREQVIDGRNGPTTYTYYNDDSVESVTSPAPGTGAPAQTTTYIYNDMGQVAITTLPDGSSVTNQYYGTGELLLTAGSQTYPVGYGYDAQGRMTKMTNWTSFKTAGERITTWNYSAARGFLSSKAYPDSTGPSYTYTGAGRLATRVWARGITTTYTHNNAGQVETISYSNSTPHVTFAYDRLGRITNVIQAGQFTNAITYNLAGQILRDVQGPNVFTNGYDTLLRRTRSSQGITFGATISYGYDSFSRLSKVTNNSFVATYNYLPKSRLVSHIGYAYNGTTRMTSMRQYDNLNRLLQISSIPSADAPISFSYLYNDVNQRTRVDTSDSAFWSYDYDDLGQVTSGKKVWSDGTAVAGQQFDYAYDDIGNRKTAASGGDQFGNNQRAESYAPTILNQYTNRTVASYLQVMGSANSSAKVTVNNTPTSRKGDYWRAELPVNNTTGAVWLQVTNTAVMVSGSKDAVTNSIASELIAKTPETFIYDADGNLLQDGQWVNTWDAENRLLTQQTAPSAYSSGTPILHLEFDYEPGFRRIQKRAYLWDGNDWRLQESLAFAYDDACLIAEIETTNKTLLRGYTFGLDLSGSINGVSGIGGILKVVHCTGSSSQNYFYQHDGNGSVVGMSDASNAGIVSSLEYGPFGEPVRRSESGIQANNFGFSGKYMDRETGCYDFGMRYLDPVKGRWLSKDPADEEGGPNLYMFVYNSPTIYVDPDGNRGLGTVGTLNPRNVRPVMELIREAEGLRRLPPPIPIPPIPGPKPPDTRKDPEPDSSRLLKNPEII